MAGVTVDDLRELWHAGAVDLPTVAAQYSEVAGQLHKTGLNQSGAFNRTGYSPTGGAASTGGRLGYEWTRLRNAVQDDIAVRSQANLVAAGRALVEIANSYATTDHLSAEQIGQYQAYVESIENNDDEFRRPPYVPDAPSSDDPHPEDRHPAMRGGY
jgi:hypothetical protein